jgi:hypothetical protein
MFCHPPADTFNFDCGSVVFPTRPSLPEVAELQSIDTSTDQSAASPARHSRAGGLVPTVARPYSTSYTR